MTTIPNFPSQYATEHLAWHRGHTDAPGQGVDFLLFHRRFVATMLAYFATRPDLAGFDFSPWSAVPAEVTSASVPPRSATDPGIRWLPEHDAAISRLHGSLGSFESVDDLGHFVEGHHSQFLHGTLHALIEDAYGDSMAMAEAPSSNHFYRLHRYLDRFLTSWVREVGPGRLWHAVRRGDTGAWTPAYLGDVGMVAGGSLRDARRVAVAVEAGQPHVLAVRSDGSLWHTLRRADGTWHSFGDVGGVAGRPGRVADVAAAWDGALLHVVVALEDQTLRHCARKADGSWTPLADLSPHVGYRGGATSVACAAAGGAAHVLVTTPQGAVRHTLRKADGSWTPLADPVGDTGAVAGATRLAATLAGPDLHVVVVTSSGAARHTVRGADGKWTRYGDLVGAAAATSWTPFHEAACAAAGSEVHVMLATRGSVVHTIRRADGSWLPVGDATGQMQCPDIPRVADLAVAMAGPDLQVVQAGGA